MSKKYMEKREFKDYPTPTYLKYNQLLSLEK